MTTAPASTSEAATKHPWPALWSMVLGFFMILVDSTIVSVANPTIMKALSANINEVIWVTSAYLLAYAVPLLITGRLGDRFGPKRLYLGGLVVFTIASALCGLAPTIGLLIAARVVQGLGAACMTPQTMAVITRIFPPERRGSAMAIWGATSGVAMLVGPIAGGLLVGVGWEWIFYVNVPVGILGFILAARNVPKLPTHPHRFDLLGVALSAAGMFLLVFGIQEGETYNWGTITGPITVWGVIIAGIVVLLAFVVWQRFNKGEPLLPLGLFRDRNFSLGNTAITAVGFTISCMALPMVFYSQIVLGLSAIESALLLVPMAVGALVLSPVTGRMLNKRDPRWFAVIGGVLMSASLFWYAQVIGTNSGWGWMLLPSALLGVSSAFVWGPIANATTRNLPPMLAGAGSGVYNTTRQVGAVLGSASIAALIQARLAADLPKLPGGGSVANAEYGGTLPTFLHDGFATAMGESLLLPASVALLVVLVSLFFAKPKAQHGWGSAAGHGTTAAGEPHAEVTAAIAE